MIYFDWTATTKPRKEVIDIYNKVIDMYWANPSSAYTLGLKASQLFDKAKENLKEALKVKDKDYDVLYTANATEANNLAIFGICNNYLKEANKYRIITTKIEHPSVYNIYKRLENLGFDCIYLDVDNNGLIDLNQLREVINKDTLLVSIMYVNNVIGTIEPINEVIDILKDYPRCKLHIDAVQAIGKIDIDVDLNKVDLITISSHKLEGLKGTATLIYKKNINITPHLHGASQQQGLVPGTIDLAGAVACTKAITLAIQEAKNHQEMINKLYNHLIERLKEIDIIELNSNTFRSSKSIVSIYVKNHRAETVMHYLESKDIYVSISSACSSKLKTIDRTLYAITKDNDRSISSIRISLSYHNTISEIDTLVNTLKEYLGK